MRFERSENRIIMSIDELASYAFQREQPSRLTEYYGFIRSSSSVSVPEAEVSRSDSISSSGEKGLFSVLTEIASQRIQTTEASISCHTLHSDVPLQKIVPYGDTSLCIGGLAPRICYDGVLHTVEECKRVTYIKNDITPLDDPTLFARAAICAYLYANDSGLSQIKIRITFEHIKTANVLSFTALFTQVALSRMFSSLLNRAHTVIRAFTERYTVFPQEVKNMPFPYHSIREGQSELIKTAYRCIKRGENLLVSAPTGIGKTISSLFPAVKSLADGAADKIFYFTAKNITGQAAMEAALRLAKHAPHFRAVMICAKEQLCPFGKKGMSRLCHTCEKMGSITSDQGFSYISYRERQLAAMTDLLISDDPIYTVERIKKTAAEHNVCPYELSLDLSESCSLVVCDYNYVIDDAIRFQRYFKVPVPSEHFVFLFDEAHNLPDRTRNTYSSKLTSDAAQKLYELSQSFEKEGKALRECVLEYKRALEEVASLCSENQTLRQGAVGEILCGFYEDNHIPDELVRTVNNLARCIGKTMREFPDLAEMLEPHYQQLKKSAFTYSYFEKGFRFFASKIGDELTLQALCLDPSNILSLMLSPAVSSILFSATLSPMDYFAEVTGLTDAQQLELVSPYERDNLSIVAYDSISTRLTDRKETAYDCAEVIAETVMCREGNYIAYFPSYEYMTAVYRAFSTLGVDCAVILQKSGMSYRERERFIQIFRERMHPTIVGFCVLGGMFSEGIDLAGESLIGSIIVGTGMPMLSAERNIMAAYYDEKTEHGHEFAYTCPGMNKVLQAAGRVIRSENDKGVIVLIDDRLGEANIKRHFPSHWRHMVYTGDCDSLRTVLTDFWNQF